MFSDGGTPWAEWHQTCGCSADPRVRVGEGSMWDERDSPTAAQAETGAPARPTLFRCPECAREAVLPPGMNFWAFYDAHCLLRHWETFQLWLPCLREEDLAGSALVEPEAGYPLRAQRTRAV